MTHTVLRILEAFWPLFVFAHCVPIDGEGYNTRPVSGKLNVELSLHSPRTIVQYDVSFVQDPDQLRLSESVFPCLDQVGIRMCVS